MKRKVPNYNRPENRMPAAVMSPRTYTTLAQQNRLDYYIPLVPDMSGLHFSSANSISGRYSNLEISLQPAQSVVSDTINAFEEGCFGYTPPYEPQHSGDFFKKNALFGIPVSAISYGRYCATTPLAPTVSASLWKTLSTTSISQEDQEVTSLWLTLNGSSSTVPYICPMKVGATISLIWSDLKLKKIIRSELGLRIVCRTFGDRQFAICSVKHQKK